MDHPADAHLENDDIWAVKAQRLHERYRGQECFRVPVVLYKRCSRRDRWYHIVVPSVMAVHNLVVETSGVMDLACALGDRVLLVAGGSPVSLAETVAAVATVGQGTTLCNAFHLALMLGARTAVDMGLIFPATLSSTPSSASSGYGQVEIVRPSSSLGLQGSALSLTSAFLLGRFSVALGQSLRAGVRLVLLMAAKVSGCAMASRACSQKWPTSTRAVSTVAKAMSWVLGTLVGLFAVVPLPVAASYTARGLDELTQQSQRVGSPMAWLLLQRCWAYWWGAPGWQKRRSMQKEIDWRWDVPEAVGVPPDLCCPITLQLLSRPVLLHGDVFEKHALKAWLGKAQRHPLRSNVPVHEDEIRTAFSMELLCHEFAAAHGLQTSVSAH